MADGARATNLTGAADGGKTDPQVVDQVIDILRATSLEAKPAAIRAALDLERHADPIEAAEAVVALHRAGRTRSRNAAAVLTAMLRSQDARRSRGWRDVRWVTDHVPDLPVPFALGALWVMRVVHGPDGVTADMVRARVERRIAPSTLELFRRARRVSAEHGTSIEAAFATLEREETAT